MDPHVTCTTCGTRHNYMEHQQHEDPPDKRILILYALLIAVTIVAIITWTANQ